MNISRRLFIKLSIISGIFSTFFNSVYVFSSKKVFASKRKEEPEKKYNLHAKRSMVVCIHSDKVTDWDYESYPYVDSINQEVVNDMIDEGIMKLTGERSAEPAWAGLLESYKDGDVIAIKPNFNDLHKEFRNNYVVSPAVLNSIIKGLVENLNVPPGNIIIYDCSRSIPDSYRERIKYSVKFVETYGSSFIRKVMYKTIGNPLSKADLDYEIKMTQEIRDKKGQAVRCFLPNVLTSADHIINVPILKSHQFVLASGAMKNHYGSVRFSDGHLFPEYLHPPVIHESIADINAHPVIREKTRLIVMDALFGRVKKKGGYPDKWKIFTNSNPNRLFLSKDPVALDSVTSFFIKKELNERREDYFSDDYLKIASEKNIGIYEMPESDDEFKNIDYMYLES